MNGPDGLEERTAFYQERSSERDLDEQDLAELLGDEARDDMEVDE